MNNNTQEFKLKEGYQLFYKYCYFGTISKIEDDFYLSIKDVDMDWVVEISQLHEIKFPQNFKIELNLVRILSTSNLSDDASYIGTCILDIPELVSRGGNPRFDDNGNEFYIRRK